ncbi:kinase-like domain-containing protein [Russula brevipes]|nr:kinase-like domain-containing protein [Russula brevipes]
MTPPPVPPRDAAAEHKNAPGRGLEEKRDEREEQGRASQDSASSSERRRPRPSDLSILPPRISLRKDTLDDLSSWSASLFSSLPSALHDSPESSASTAATTAELSKPDISKHRTKPSVTLPTIVLHPEVREENEDEEDENEEVEEVAEHDYSNSASPLYHELMGMMQGRAAPTTNGAGSPGPGSPASTDFQHDTASSSSHGASSRDSQLTIRFNPRRDSSRDSSASTSTLTHATIVRGASIVRRVRADVVTTPPVFARLKGKQREQEQAPIVVQEDDDVDDEDDDSSSDASGSDEDADQEALLRLASPASSPLRATFPEPESEEQEQTQNEETQKSLVQDAYVTPPPSAPPVSVHWPPAAISTADLENSDGVLPSLLSSASSEPAKELENGAMTPRFTSTGAATPRYPSWLAAIVLPLAEFMMTRRIPMRSSRTCKRLLRVRAAPCTLHTLRLSSRPSSDRQRRARQRRSGCSSPSSLSDDESGASEQKPTLVAIKRVRLIRDTTTGLTDLRRELELARALRHANVLRMERLYVDVVEESLWIGMELMDRSLADVLAVVGEEVEDGSGGGGESGGSGGAGLVELSEKMVARFVWDVLLALSFIRKHQIAHRDVRSDNLLLSKSGVLKLSDFSTAVHSPPGTPKRSDSAGVIYWQAPEMRTGLYDPLKVDVWSLGATTWELVHCAPPFADVQDTRQIVGAQLPPVRQPEAFSRSFHDFLLLCSQPAATRPDPDELLNTYFIRTACPRSEVVRLLGQCRTIDEHQLRRQSCDSDF